MRAVIIAAILAMPLGASGKPLSLSGHWQDQKGTRIFLHHRTDGRIDAWVPIHGGYVPFMGGTVAQMTPADPALGAVYEIDAKSDSRVDIRIGNQPCRLENLRFSMWGLLVRSGWRGRNMVFQGVGDSVSGILVCGERRAPWAMPTGNSWKRL